MTPEARREQLDTYAGTVMAHLRPDITAVVRVAPSLRSDDPDEADDAKARLTTATDHLARRVMLAVRGIRRHPPPPLAS